ncbi:MAG: glycine betaine/L-proline ABC transporter ATP-binding protein [Acetobacterales bacterium]
MADQKLAVRNLTRIFGPDPDAALALLKEGKSKDEILRETGNTVGVQDCSFDVGEGEIFVVMGLSGSGKSTLIRMINRLIEPTSGQVVIDGIDLTAADMDEVRRIRLDKISMVFQHFALFPHRTVRENVEYGLKIKGVDAAERRERAQQALEQVGLADWADKPPADLSGGMQQRVGLARGLAVEPEVLLMDEPFSALDPLIRRTMQEELLTLQREVRKTIVFITHDLNEALILGDRIAIMKEGRFVQVGTPQDIVAHPADDYVAAFTSDVDRGRVFTAESVMDAAHTLKLGEDTPETALQKMTELDRDALYVMEGRKIAGIVTYRDLAGTALEADGDGSGYDTLEDALVRDFPVVELETQLSEVYEQCSSGLPSAVLCHQGWLQGVIEPSRVFEALAPDEQTQQQEARPAAQG